MRRRQYPSAGLLELARLQSGVLSAEQIAGHGLSSKAVARLVAEAQWRRMTTGLILASPEPPSWTAWAWGGVLLGGDEARLGGRAAAHLWGLTDQPAEILVLVGLDRKMSQRQDWRFVREPPGFRLRSRSSPPRTGVEDSVLDLCTEAEEKEVIGVVTAAVQKQLTLPTRLGRRLERRGRHRHSTLIRDLIHDADAGAESPLELAYLRDVERAHGLPKGERQLRAGRFVQDVRYRAYATVVELDGKLGHEGLDRFRDMRRDNEVLVRGEVTLRYGFDDVRLRPCEVAFQVGSVLVDRGWNGMPSRCSRCATALLGDLLVSSGS